MLSIFNTTREVIVFALIFALFIAMVFLIKLDKKKMCKFEEIDTSQIMSLKMEPPKLEQMPKPTPNTPPVNIPYQEEVINRNYSPPKILKKCASSPYHNSDTLCKDIRNRDYAINHILNKSNNEDCLSESKELLDKYIEECTEQYKITITDDITGDLKFSGEEKTSDGKKITYSTDNGDKMIIEFIGKPTEVDNWVVKTPERSGPMSHEILVTDSKDGNLKGKIIVREEMKKGLRKILAEQNV